MSDTAQEPTPDTSQSLASLLAGVTIDGSVSAQYASGTQLSRDEAIAALETRLSWQGTTRPSPAGGTPAERKGHQRLTPGSAEFYGALYDTLPPNLRTAEALKVLDLRPFLAAIDGTATVQTYMGEPNLPFDFDVAEQLAKLDTDIRALFEAQLPTTLSPEARQAQLDRVMAFTPGRAGVDPLSNQAALDAVASGQVSAGFDPTKIGDTSMLFPTTEMRGLVQAGNMTIDQIAGSEADAGGDATFPIAVEPAVGRGRQSMEQQYMGATDATQYLYTLTPSELKNLQKRLAAAGYYDRVGAGTYIEGEVSDANTLAAWKLVLTDAVAKNTPVPTLINEGMNSYRENVRAARLKDLQQMDPTYAANLGSEYAMTVIGRGLTGDEQDQLRKYLQSLVSKRAGYVGAADNPGGVGPLTSATGYTETDVQTFVNQEHSSDRYMQISAERWGASDAGR